MAKHQTHKSLAAGAYFSTFTGSNKASLFNYSKYTLKLKTFQNYSKFSHLYDLYHIKVYQLR